jgi:hypothetical protein
MGFHPAEQSSRSKSPMAGNAAFFFSDFVLRISDFSMRLIRNDALEMGSIRLWRVVFGVSPNTSNRLASHTE